MGIIISLLLSIEQKIKIYSDTAFLFLLLILITYYNYYIINY
nr:hypothetical protein RU987_pgp136 [Laurencia catarinensis]WMP12444.1 hypothetical protein [Laurencia catarinensis]